jgi:hypothetical protein
MMLSRELIEQLIIKQVPKHGLVVVHRRFSSKIFVVVVAHASGDIDVQHIHVSVFDRNERTLS